MDDWKRERIERDRRDYLRKMTSPAEARMRSRTAKEQLAESMRLSRGPDEIPDADDASAWRGND
jgi:hypothetical protein